MAKPTADDIKSNIQAEDAEVWNQAEQRPEGLDVFETDLAEAIAKAWLTVEDAFAIASVPVTGGSSSPGGPLEGGIATLSSGMLTNTESFSLIANRFSSSFPDGPTEELLALVDAIAQGIGQKFPLWVASYSATLTASRGTCAWSAGPPPLAGAWSDGEIEEFAIENGTSTGDLEMTANSLKTAIGNAADPSQLKQNQNTLQPALSALIKAIAKGFETTWTNWKKNTKISGGSGLGTAIPPNGVVVGAVTSPRIG